jgi:lipopolysaccharide heptosyltransferase II
MKRFTAFLTYLLYRSVESAARLLPMTLCWYLGAAAGTLASWLLPSYRHLARRNLTIAFARDLSTTQINQLTRQHFKTLGGNLLCSLKMPWIPVGKLKNHLTIEGVENVELAFKAGRGFIYALLHMGNWEVLSQVVVSKGTSGGAMYQPLTNPFLDAHVLRCRQRTGCRLFNRHDGFNGPVRWLRNNGGVGILVDQHAGDAGQWSPLFGRLASTTNLAALLSRKTGAPILPVSVVTDAPGRWRMIISPKLDAPPDIELATAALNVALESNIRSSPHDWFWVHNRWKTPNPEFLLAKYRRGITLPPSMPPDSLQPFHILVRSPNWLGDACMAVPAVRALKRGRPDARVTILAPEKIAAVWRMVPDVDEVIPFPKNASILTVANLLKKAGHPWDSGILLPNSLRSALEMKLAGVLRIVGYKGHWRRKLLHQIIPPRKKVGPVEHHSRFYLRIAWRLGANVEDPSLHDPVLPPPEPSSPLTLGLCAGAEYGPAKRWPLDRFAEAARAVASKLPCHWLIFGAPAEKNMGAQLASLIGTSAENLAGQTTLDELAARLRQCRLLLTNDTGTMHFAQLLGTPVIAIFGSTEPAATGPLSPASTVVRRHVECSPCFRRTCPIDFRCMLEIPADTVADTVLAKLGSA